MSLEPVELFVMRELARPRGGKDLDRLFIIREIYKSYTVSRMLTVEAQIAIDEMLTNLIEINQELSPLACLRLCQ